MGVAAAMILHLTYSSTVRLLAVLAMALAFVVLIASSAATPANAGSSQWMFAQPHSWGHSNGWRRQHGGMQQGGMQNWGRPRFDGNGSRQFDMGDFQQFGMGGFRHDGGNSHHNGDDFSHDRHDHFHNGFVIVSPGFFNPFVNPFFFNRGFAGAPVFVSPSFVTPPFNVQQTPFIVTQPGFVGQPFVAGQPQFFLGLGSANRTDGFVESHPSLGQSSWWHRTDNGWRRSPTMHSSVTVIRPGTPITGGNVTVIRPGMN
jgi:hypothetical protein